MAIAEDISKIGLPMTEEELMSLPDDGYLYELVDGFVVGKQAASFQAGAIAANIIWLFGPYVRGKGVMTLGKGVMTLGKGVMTLGKGVMTLGKGGFRMVNGSIRVPATSFTRKDRLPGGHAPDTFGDLAPDLCVEIIRPTEDWADMTCKVREYFDTGAVQVWHVFPERQEVTVFTSPTETQTLSADGILDTGGILPGFSCRVSDLFETE